MKLQPFLNALCCFLLIYVIGCVVLWALARHLEIQHSALRIALLFTSICGAAAMFVLAAERLPTDRDAVILSLATLLPFWFVLWAIQRISGLPFHGGIVAMQSIAVLAFGSLIYGYLFRRHASKFEKTAAKADATSSVKPKDALIQSSTIWAEPVEAQSPRAMLIDKPVLSDVEGLNAHGLVQTFHDVPPVSPTPQPVDPTTEALLNAICERSKEDSFTAAKVGALEIYDLVFRGLKDARGGVHVESLLCVLGALAGYACQARVRALCASQGKVETAEFVVVTGADGKIHYFGDALNERLAEHEHSLWRLAGGMAQHCGATELPEVHETFSYIASVVGTSRFGLPRVTEEHRPCSTPLEFVTTLWPALLPKVKLICPDPELWPLLFGLAVQKAMEDGKLVIDPAMAMKLAMEAAIAMSKIDLENACAAST